MPDEDLHASESNHAEEFLDGILPGDHQPTKVMKLSKKSFYSPTSAITA